MNLIVSSIKGGVGKTTVTVGLAKAFQKSGLRVGILDLDYRSPSVHLLLASNHVELQHGPGDSLVPPVVDGIAVFSTGYIWPPDKAVMMEDDLAVEDVKQLIVPGAIAWPELDILVVDSPPTSSGIVLAALEMPGLTGVVTVTQASTLSRAAFLRTLDLFAECRIPVYAVICNQSVDENGKQRFDLSVADIEAIASESHIPVFVSIPHTDKRDSYFDNLVLKLSAVQPVVLPRKEPEDRAWKKLVELSHKLTKPT